MSNPDDKKPQPVAAAGAVAASAGPKTLAEFLESYGPDAAYKLPDLITITSTGPDILSQPEINLHCEKCDGVRRFQTTEKRYVKPNGLNYHFVTYVCRNCGEIQKTFAVVFMPDGGKSGRIQKLGEHPPFGPPTPPRVITLIGKDRELFLMGRRAELRGLA